MALPTKTNGVGLRELFGTSGSESMIGQAITGMALNVVHEVGSGVEGIPVTEFRVIPPSGFPTIVAFRSEVVGLTTSQPNREYIATVRRRKARNLADSLAELAQYCERSDFSVWTFPILEQTKEILAFLADAQNEGNTREILRQLRDTFLNGGWDNYRRFEARNLAFSIAEHLASAVEVLPKDANEAFDKLLRVNLNPVGHFMFSAEMEGDTSDDEEED